MTMLVTGGVRSGKSRYAAERALVLCATPVFLATARVVDEDFAKRIERHQQDRSDAWETLEEPLRPADQPLAGRTVVLDCVTLWLSNVFEAEGYDPDRTEARMRAEIDRLFAIDCQLFVVTNELGMGVHPPSESGRVFRDIQGVVNQVLAQRADDVVLMVSGIPVEIKKATS